MTSRVGERRLQRSRVDALVEELRANHRIAVVPGNPRFFGPGAEGHVRISFATSRRLLHEGLARLARGLTGPRPGRDGQSIR